MSSNIPYTAANEVEMKRSPREKLVARDVYTHSGDVIIQEIVSISDSREWSRIG